MSSAAGSCRLGSLITPEGDLSASRICLCAWPYILVPLEKHAGRSRQRGLQTTRRTKVGPEDARKRRPRLLALRPRAREQPQYVADQPDGLDSCKF